MDCEFCAGGEPVEVYDLPTQYGRRSVCSDCLQRYGRSPPEQSRRAERACFSSTNETGRPCKDGRSPENYPTH